MVGERHIRNIPALSEKDMERLAESRVLVAGCGGLGGNVIEQLARIGVGALTVADGDVFERSNLNRQILCTDENLGESKAVAAAERIKAIDPSVKVAAVTEFLTKENAPALLADADIVMDCLDSIASRLMLEDAAAAAGTALVHGAVSGWDLQAMLVPPGSGLLRELYGDMHDDGPGTSLPMAPAACASLQVSLAVRYLCGRGAGDSARLIIGSLQDMNFDSVDLKTR